MRLLEAHGTHSMQVTRRIARLIESAPAGGIFHDAVLTEPHYATDFVDATRFIVRLPATGEEFEITTRRR